MSRDVLWLVATALAISMFTLGTIGLLAHISEGRSASVLAFDVLWMTGSLLIGNVCWRRTKWGAEG